MIFDSIDLDRRLVEKGGLKTFVRLAWPHIDGSRFVDNWHIHEICAHLEAVTRGEIKRLVINVPPGTGKSLIASVFWPVWSWIVRGDRRYMYASFDASLAQRDALRAKDLIRSTWFQQRWGALATGLLQSRGQTPLFILESGTRDIQDNSTVYYTNSGGLRFSTSVGGKATGWHAHVQVVDDPTKPYALQGGGSKAINDLKATREWWSGTMSTRHADPKDFARVVIMQRLHEDDLAAECIRDGYVALILPMRYVPATRCVTPWGGDRREVDDELLFPQRFPREAVETIERELGPAVASAQLQQSPTPASGSIFRPEWLLQRWATLPQGLFFIASWDMTFSGKAGSDFVAGQVWGGKTEVLPSPADPKKKIVRESAYLVDRVYERLDFADSVAAVRHLRMRRPEIRKIVIEDKANGPAVASALQNEFRDDLILVTPQGDKVSRANSVTLHFSSGNVWLPPDVPWILEYTENMRKFPRALNDDDVDATSQALIHFFGSPAERYKRALMQLGGPYR